MPTERITNIDDFEALAPQWDALVEAMGRPSPFLLHGWLAEWWRHCADGAQPSIEIIRDQGRLAGALPLAVRRRGGLRIASFMGDAQTVLCDLLLSPEATPDVTDSLTGALYGGDYDVADLHGLPADSHVARALGTRLETIQRIEAPVVDLNGGWDAVYRAKTNAKKRNLHKRRRRQLSELGELTVTVAREPDELAPALEEAFQLHALRWEGRPDGSGFTSEAGRRFHRAALQRLATQGIPRIVTLRLDGRAIAFHYWFALAGRMYVHRLAFDPALARWSPGLVNTLDALEAAAAEGMTRVEFLGGGERYKTELADGFAPLYQGYAAPGGLRGRAYVAAQLAAIRARLALKRNERLHRLYFDDLARARTLGRRLRVSGRAPRAPAAP
jgi:CelD/BcsL family acetyltransferase involved in cellulose biosynthesis